MTLSITGRCERTGQLGLAMSSYDVNFAPARSLAFAGIGAVAAQANTPEGVSQRIVALLWEGRTAARALAEALERESGKERSQLGVVDAAGRAAAFTGERTMAWSGHLTGAGWAAAGNILAGPHVVAALGEAFVAGDALPLDERLIGALEAGIAAGGDRRGQRSAYLRVATGEPITELEVRAHEHDRPMAELRRLLAVHRGQSNFFTIGIEANAAIRARLTRAELEAFADLTTHAAIERIRGVLAGGEDSGEALDKVDRLLAAFPLRPDFAEQRFGDLLKASPRVWPNTDSVT
ncbi:MAG: DUF1028 domain-containing protein [Chloroflexi bacterium]|nr:DUF1028 domain-containing protein [Chloroflexota bacterium]